MNGVEGISVSVPRLGELEEQEFKRRQAEKDKISLVEGLFFFLLAATADVFEIVLPLVGLIFGFFASGVILMWLAVLKSDASSYLIFRRVIITIGGWILDAATLGLLPIRTIALLLTIWVNNRDANGRIKEAVGRIDKLLRSV